MLNTAQLGLGSCCARKSAKARTKLDKCQRSKVRDTQFNQSQQEDPVDDDGDMRMTVLHPGMYSCCQFTAVEQQQMAYLKNQTTFQTFNQPQNQPFSGPVRRLYNISERGPYTVQYNGPLPYPDQSAVVENYN